MSTVVIRWVEPGLDKLEYVGVPAKEAEELGRAVGTDKVAHFHFKYIASKSREAYLDMRTVRMITFGHDS